MCAACGEDKQPTPLYWAINAANVEMVKLFIEEGADANTAVSEDNETHLHRAVIVGCLKIVEILLKAHANPNAVTLKEQLAPLYCAAWTGNARIVELLLSFGAQIDQPNRSSKETALHCAIREHHVDVVRVLIDAGADITVRYCNWGAALDLAACAGSIEIVTMLLESRGCISPQALYESARSGYSDIVMMLLAERKSIGKLRTLLDIATQRCSEECVRAVIRAHRHDGDDAIANCASRALYSAACRGSHVHAEVLLSAGADPNSNAVAQTHTALHVAAYEGHTDVVRVLLDAGADVNSVAHDYHMTPLYWASARGNAVMVTMLLQAGADVMTVNNYAKSAVYFDDDEGDCVEETALHAAASRGHSEVVRLLLAAGARPDVLGCEIRATPLYCAVTGRKPGHWRAAQSRGAEQRREEAVRLLLAAGADPNVRCRDNDDTALCAAVRGLNIAMTRALLAAGADPNARSIDCRHSAPLVFAALHLRLDMVRVLMEHGAQVNVECHRYMHYQYFDPEIRDEISFHAYKVMMKIILMRMYVMRLTQICNNLDYAETIFSVHIWILWT